MIHGSRVAVLGVILRWHAHGGKSPSVSDLAREVGLSRTRVFMHLRDLRADGLVDWEEKRVGTLRPLVRVVQ